MACVIEDLVVKFDQENLPVPIPRSKVTVSPSQGPLFVKDPTIYREIGPIPQRVIGTDELGIWSVTLPWPSEQDPTYCKWIIELPDNSKWMGAIPEGISGPLTLHDLKTSYGWGLVTATNRELVPVAVQGPPFTIQVYSNATRPDASNVPAGHMIWNSDDLAPNFSDGTEWRDAFGAST